MELQLVRGKDGKSNIQSLLAVPPVSTETQVSADKPPEPEEPSALAVNVEEVRISRGQIRFSDATLKPSFEMTLGSPDLLVQGLHEKVKLKLDIEGHVDRTEDIEALREQQLNKWMKAQELKELLKQGKSDMALDQVSIAVEEYVHYLKMVCTEQFPKATGKATTAADLSGPEMKQALLAKSKVGEDDLEVLARKRALKVKEYILSSGKVEPKRVFLVEPKSLEPEKDPGLAASRVTISLK